MAEEGSVYDLKGLEKQLQSLFSRYTCNDLQADSKPFCSSFCKLVEHYASYWQVPLPQLRILEKALCYFTQVSAFFTVNCDHVLRTLSSLALSIFELLLFFDPKDFYQDPLKKITVTFQECCSVLARHQNVHLLQVERLLQDGGPWACQTLQAILSESNLPQTEVVGSISSEPPVFFELRVRYLLSCHRLTEALALAKCCAQHPTVGQHLFFFQVYLIGLYKTSQDERLLEEVAHFSGKDAVLFLCSLESEEKDELLLGLSRAFLSHQLGRGDMHFLCDLVFIWSKLHSRLRSTKEVLLKECKQLMLFATNVNAIFPFIRVIIQELSEDGIPFCVELCANALRSCLPCDVITKSLIYKTIASLLPSDLEICRACALLVFFLERSVEAYKMVYILYMHPDQEYYVDCCPIGNRVRFETLQILKKDLYFDPEFWNLITLRTNCLKLINEKVLSAALEEIMEEKWVPNYFLNATSSSSSESISTKENGLNKAKKPHKGGIPNHKDGTDKAPRKKIGRPRLNNHHSLNKKGNQGSRQWKVVSSEPPRRSSFWQLDRIHCNRAMDNRENRRTTRLSEKIPAKRRIRTPKWLLEDSGTLENNAPLKMRRQHSRLHYLPIVKRSEGVKNNTKDKVNIEVKVKENEKKMQKEVPSEPPTAAASPQVVLELSLPDNELLGSFTDESCNRHRGLPQMLFYRPTVKVPSAVEPEKSTLQNEMILKAQDASMFTEMLHCYARRSKAKKSGTTSTITRSSGQVSASKEEQLCDKPTVEMKVIISEQTHEVTEKELQGSRKKLDLYEKDAVTRDADKVQEAKVKQSSSKATVITGSAVEMKVRVTSQNHRHSPRLEKSQNADPISSTVLKKSMPEKKNAEISDQTLPIFSNEHSKSQDPIVTNLEVLNLEVVNGTPTQEEKLSSTESENSQVPVDNPTVKCTERMSETKTIESHKTMDNMNTLDSLSLETEIKIEALQSQDNTKDPATVNSELIESKIENYTSTSTPSCSLAPNTLCEDDDYDSVEPHPECEESKLEFCCFFCHKDIKGSQVVAHAMFHYRKDECMFCGMAFKNDLKAMMHLSNHLEKLKKLQNATAANKPHKKPKTRDMPKNSVKPQIVSNEKKRGRGRPKKQLPTVRKLRSEFKFRNVMKQEQQRSVKGLRSKAQEHKVNGLIVKRKDNDRLKDNLITKTRLRHRSNEKSTHKDHEINYGSSALVKIEKDESLVMCTEDKHEEMITCKSNKQTVMEKKVQEKLCCPVDGCSWFTHKNRVAFLYHALEDHYSDTRPLELAFRVANNICSICKRVLYSFEHFQLHIERHRSVPRHPCLHKGCTARFKSSMEMRRHARKHSPLQAVCCVPGCPRLFICLWALILHEKDHFLKRSVQQDVMQRSTHSGVKQENEKPKVGAIKKDVKSACVKRQAPHTSTEKPANIPFSFVKSPPKDTNERKDSSISYTKLSAKPAATRLLQKVRKMQASKTNLIQHRTLGKERKSKIVSYVGKPFKKLRHTSRKKINEPEEQNKMLPPRLTKSSQNSTSGRNALSENAKQGSNQAKTLVVCKKSKEKTNKNPDGTKTTEEGKVHRKHQKVANAKVTRKTEHLNFSKTSNSKTPNTEKTKTVQRMEEVAVLVVDSSVIEENANMEATDTFDSMALVIDSETSKTTSVKKHLAEATKETFNNAEKSACQNEPSEMLESTNVELEFVQNVDKVEAQVEESSALEESAMVDPTISSNYTNECETVVSPVVSEAKQVPAPFVENTTEVSWAIITMDSSANDNIASVTRNCEHDVEVDITNSEQEKKMQATVPSNSPPNITNLDYVENVVKPEHVPGEEDSKMATTKSSDVPSCPPVITALDQNVATPQSVAGKGDAKTGTPDHVIEPCVSTLVQTPEYIADSDVENPVAENSKTEMTGISIDNAKEGAIENSFRVQNVEHLAAPVDWIRRIETKDLSANHINKSSAAITSEVGHIATTEHSDPADSSAKDTNDAALFTTSTGLNETSMPAAVFKTSIKSKKKDQLMGKNEEKKRGRKRLKEPFKTSSSRKVKPDKHVAVSTITSSATEIKAVTEITDLNIPNSCAPACTSSNAKVVSKDKVAKVKKVKKKTIKDKTRALKEKNVKKQGITKNKPEKKPTQTSTNADDKIKKRKKKQCDSKTDKQKSVQAKSATKTQVSSSSQVEKVAVAHFSTSTPIMVSTSFNEVNVQASTAEGNNKASYRQEISNEDGIIVKKQQIITATGEPKSKMARKPPVETVTKKQAKTCTKSKTNVYDLVPEEEENPLAAFEKALSEYKKRPYMRLPATAYLEEKFTIMPKRRKDMSMFFGSARKIAKTHEAPETVTQQRQRCANCLSTFSSEEELQWHLQQKCSSLFGFDSDEEGTS